MLEVQKEKEEQDREVQPSMGYQESLAGESRSNGSAENAVQQIRKHTRVIRDGLELAVQSFIQIIKIVSSHIPEITWNPIEKPSSIKLLFIQNFLNFLT